MQVVTTRLDSTRLDSTSDDFQKGWLTCLDADPRGSVYLHPEILSGIVGEGSDAATILAMRDDDQSPDQIRSLAVLRRHKHATYLSRLCSRFRLRSRKLANNVILGANDQVTISAMIREFVRILRSGEEDLLFFRDIEVDSPLWNALIGVDDRRVAVIRPSESQVHRWIDFPLPAEDYWKKFSSKSRYNLRRQAKQFDHSVSFYSERGDVGPFLEKAHLISMKSWQTKRLGLRIKNSPEERTYWELVASRGAMRSYVLEQGDVPVAFLLGVQWKGCFVVEEIGFDPAYRDSAPGSILLFRVLEDLTSRSSPELLDFGFGDNVYKQIYGNRATQSGSIILLRQSFLPMAVMKLEETRRASLDRARAISKRLGIFSHIKKIYKK